MASASIPPTQSHRRRLIGTKEYAPRDVTLLHVLLLVGGLVSMLSEVNLVEDIVWLYQEHNAGTRRAIQRRRCHI